MTKTLTLIFAFCSLVFGFEQLVLGQAAQVRTSNSQPAEMTNREQDGLKGPVRRVRVETSTILIKGGEVTEGPRVARGVSTYDAAGRKIDSVDYAIDSSTPPGKERYLYDKNGNIVEMDVVGNDGSVLSKEFYEYETDQLGNWTKRRTLVAIYENGKVTSEPMEVTYRSISYYYNQAIEKLSASAPRSKGAAPSSVASPLAGAVNEQRKPLQQRARNQTTNQAAAEATNVSLKPPAKETPPNIQTNNNDARAVEPVPKEASEVAPAPTATNTSTPVLKVTEDVLRSAAMDLPQPEFPVGAVLSQASEKIEVQLLVDTKGNVTNARATSGNPLLAHAAETAALKARFSTAKLSPNAALIFGVITYDFALPAAPAVAKPAANSPTERRSEAFSENKVAAVETKPTSNAAPASDYERGMTFLAAGSYEEAASAFNQAVQVNPNNANAYVKLAMSYSGMHRDKEALAGFKMASQIDRRAIDSRAYYMWGGSYLALEKPSEAISAFKQALAITRSEAIGAESTDNPNAPSAEQLHQGLGIAYMNSSRFNEAVKEFQQVVLLNPQNADAHYALAMAYLVNGDRTSAEKQNRILASLNAELAQKVKAAITTPVAPGCRNIACR